MTDEQNIDTIGVGLTLDTTEFDAGVSRAQAAMESLEQKRSAAFVMPNSAAVNPVFRVRQSDARGLKTDINKHLKSLAAGPNGEAVLVPVKLNVSATNWAAMRQEIAERIGSVPITVNLTTMNPVQSRAATAGLSVPGQTEQAQQEGILALLAQQRGGSIVDTQRAIRTAAAARAVPTRAHGGPMFPGTTYLLGESHAQPREYVFSGGNPMMVNGPTLVRPKKMSYAVPSAKAESFGYGAPMLSRMSAMTQPVRSSGYQARHGGGPVGPRVDRRMEDDGFLNQRHDRFLSDERLARFRRQNNEYMQHNLSSAIDWRKQDWRSLTPQQKIEPVSLRTLMHLRELDRGVIPAGNERYMRELEKKLSKGWDPDQYIPFTYSPRDHSAMLFDGNHRVEVARRLGMESLPAVMMVRPMSLGSGGGMHRLPGNRTLEPDDYGYIPRELPPSWAGFRKRGGWVQMAKMGEQLFGSGRASRGNTVRSNMSALARGIGKNFIPWLGDNRYAQNQTRTYRKPVSYAGYQLDPKHLNPIIDSFDQITQLALDNPTGIPEFVGKIWYPGRRRAIIQEQLAAGNIDVSGMDGLSTMQRALRMRKAANMAVDVSTIISPGVKDTLIADWTDKLLTKARSDTDFMARVASGQADKDDITQWAQQINQQRRKERSVARKKLEALYPDRKTNAEQRAQFKQSVRQLQTDLPGLTPGRGYGDIVKAVKVMSGQMSADEVLASSPKVKPFRAAERGPVGGLFYGLVDAINQKTGLREKSFIPKSFKDFVIDSHMLDAAGLPWMLIGKYAGSHTGKIFKDKSGKRQVASGWTGSKEELESRASSTMTKGRPTYERALVEFAASAVHDRYKDRLPGFKQWQATTWIEHFPRGDKPDSYAAAAARMVVPKSIYRREDVKNHPGDRSKWRLREDVVLPEGFSVDPKTGALLTPKNMARKPWRALGGFARASIGDALPDWLMKGRKPSSFRTARVDAGVFRGNQYDFDLRPINEMIPEELTELFGADSTSPATVNTARFLSHRLWRDDRGVDFDKAGELIAELDRRVQNDPSIGYVISTGDLRDAFDEFQMPQFQGKARRLRKLLSAKAAEAGRIWTDTRVGRQAYNVADFDAILDAGDDTYTLGARHRINRTAAKRPYRTRGLDRLIGRAVSSLKHSSTDPLRDETLRDQYMTLASSARLRTEEELIRTQAAREVFGAFEDRTVQSRFYPKLAKHLVVSRLAKTLLDTHGDNLITVPRLMELFFADNVAEIDYESSHALSQGRTAASADAHSVGALLVQHGDVALAEQYAKLVSGHHGDRAANTALEGSIRVDPRASVDRWKANNQDVEWAEKHLQQADLDTRGLAFDLGSDDNDARFRLRMGKIAQGSRNYRSIAAGPHLFDSFVEDLGTARPEQRRPGMRLNAMNKWGLSGPDQISALDYDRKAFGRETYPDYYVPDGYEAYFANSDYFREWIKNRGAYLLADQFVASWADSSSKSSTSLASQIIATELFGLGGDQLDILVDKQANYDRYSNPDHARVIQNIMPGHRPGVLGNREAIETMLMSQYQTTQEGLAKAGVNRIPLFRGTAHKSPLFANSSLHDIRMQRIPLPTAPVRRPTTNPLMSWSVDPRTAQGFMQHTSGVVYAADVPAERVLSTSMTGYGASNEFEAVVLGEADVEDRANAFVNSAVAHGADPFMSHAMQSAWETMFRSEAGSRDLQLFGDQSSNVPSDINSDSQFLADDRSGLSNLDRWKTARQKAALLSITRMLRKTGRIPNADPQAHLPTNRIKLLHSGGYAEARFGFGLIDRFRDFIAARRSPDIDSVFGEDKEAKEAYLSTLKNEGGTFPTFPWVRNPDRGWAVGINRGKQSAAVINPKDAAAFHKAYRRIAADAQGMDSNYVGTWIDNNLIHMDPATVVETKRDANVIGRVFDQIGIYGLRRKKPKIPGELGESWPGHGYHETSWPSGRKTDAEGQVILTQRQKDASARLIKEAYARTIDLDIAQKFGIQHVSQAMGVDEEKLRNVGMRKGGGFATAYRGKGALMKGAGFVPGLRSVAQEYMREAGLPRMQAHRLVPINEDFSRRTAEAYELLPDEPDDLGRASYAAFAKETQDQYDFLVSKGFTFEPSIEDPYTPIPGDPRTKMQLVAEDVAKNRHMFSFASYLSHPILTDEENLTFRHVHDMFGHLTEGLSIGPKGEFNAAIKHSRMYSPLAKRVMLAETHGQNSVVNFGQRRIPEMGNRTIEEINRERPGTIYADNKTRGLPEELIAEFERLTGTGVKRRSTGGSVLWRGLTVDNVIEHDPKEILDAMNALQAKTPINPLPNFFMRMAGRSRHFWGGEAPVTSKPHGLVGMFNDPNSGPYVGYGPANPLLLPRNVKDLDLILEGNMDPENYILGSYDAQGFLAGLVAGNETRPDLNISVRPNAVGQGHAKRLLDALYQSGFPLVDQGTINTNSFTPEGKALMTKWLLGLLRQRRQETGKASGGFARADDGVVINGVRLHNPDNADGISAEHHEYVARALSSLTEKVPGVGGLGLTDVMWRATAARVTGEDYFDARPDSDAAYNWSMGQAGDLSTSPNPLERMRGAIAPYVILNSRTMRPGSDVMMDPEVPLADMHLMPEITGMSSRLGHGETRAVPGTSNMYGRLAHEFGHAIDGGVRLRATKAWMDAGVAPDQWMQWLLQQGQADPDNSWFALDQSVMPRLYSRDKVAKLSAYSSVGGPSEAFAELASSVLTPGAHISTQLRPEDLSWLGRIPGRVGEIEQDAKEYILPAQQDMLRLIDSFRKGKASGGFATANGGVKIPRDRMFRPTPRLFDGEANLRAIHPIYHSIEALKDARKGLLRKHPIGNMDSFFDDLAPDYFFADANIPTSYKSHGMWASIGDHKGILIPDNVPAVGQSVPLVMDYEDQMNLVAYDDAGLAAGLLSGNPSDGEVNLAVRQDAQGMGFGRRLLQTAYHMGFPLVEKLENNVFSGAGHANRLSWLNRLLREELRAKRTLARDNRQQRMFPGNTDFSESDLAEFKDPNWRMIAEARRLAVRDQMDSRMFPPAGNSTFDAIQNDLNIGYGGQEALFDQRDAHYGPCDGTCAHSSGRGMFTRARGGFARASLGNVKEEMLRRFGNTEQNIRGLQVRNPVYHTPEALREAILDVEQSSVILPMPYYFQSLLGSLDRQRMAGLSTLEETGQPLSIAGVYNPRVAPDTLVPNNIKNVPLVAIPDLIGSNDPSMSLQLAGYNSHGDIASILLGDVRNGDVLLASHPDFADENMISQLGLTAYHLGFPLVELGSNQLRTEQGKRAHLLFLRSLLRDQLKKQRLNGVQEELWPGDHFNAVLPDRVPDMSELDISDEAFYLRQRENVGFSGEFDRLPIILQYQENERRWRANNPYLRTQHPLSESATGGFARAMAGAADKKFMVGGVEVDSTRMHRSARNMVADTLGEMLDKYPALKDPQTPGGTLDPLGRVSMGHDFMNHPAQYIPYGGEIELSPNFFGTGGWRFQSISKAGEHESNRPGGTSWPKSAKRLFTHELIHAMQYGLSNQSDEVISDMDLDDPHGVAAFLAGRISRNRFAAPIVPSMAARHYIQLMKAISGKGHGFGYGPDMRYPDTSGVVDMAGAAISPYSAFDIADNRRGRDFRSLMEPIAELGSYIETPDYPFTKKFSEALEDPVVGPKFQKIVAYYQKFAKAFKERKAGGGFASASTGAEENINGVSFDRSGISPMNADKVSNILRQLTADYGFVVDTSLSSVFHRHLPEWAADRGLRWPVGTNVAMYLGHEGWPAGSDENWGHWPAQDPVHGEIVLGRDFALPNRASGSFGFNKSGHLLSDLQDAKAARRNNTVPYHVSGTLDGVVAHEFGHALETHIRRVNNVSRADISWSSATNNSSGSIMRDLVERLAVDKALLSGYAAEDYGSKEAFAELFASQTVPTTVPIGAGLERSLEIYRDLMSMLRRGKAGGGFARADDGVVVNGVKLHDPHDFDRHWIGDEEHEYIAKALESLTLKVPGVAGNALHDVFWRSSLRFLSGEDRFERATDAMAYYNFYRDRYLDTALGRPSHYIALHPKYFRKPLLSRRSGIAVMPDMMHEMAQITDETSVMPSVNTHLVPGSNSVYGMVSHEFGHAVDKLMRDRTMAASQSRSSYYDTDPDSVQEYKNIQWMLTNPQNRAKISGYSMRDPDEAFAEIIGSVLNPHAFLGTQVDDEWLKTASIKDLIDKREEARGFGMNIQNSVMNMIKALAEGRASGGKANETTYLVGELQPELFIPARLSHIIPENVMNMIPKRSEGGSVERRANGGYMRRMSGGGQTRQMADGIMEIGTVGPHFFQPPEDGWIIPHHLVGQVNPHIPRAAAGKQGKKSPRNRHQAKIAGKYAKMTPDLAAEPEKPRPLSYAETLAQSPLGSAADPSDFDFVTHQISAAALEGSGSQVRRLHGLTNRAVTARAFTDPIAQGGRRWQRDVQFRVHEFQKARAEERKIAMVAEEGRMTAGTRQLERDNARQRMIDAAGELGVTEKAAIDRLKARTPNKRFDRLVDQEEVIAEMDAIIREHADTTSPDRAAALKEYKAARGDVQLLDQRNEMYAKAVKDLPGATQKATEAQQKLVDVYGKTPSAIRQVTQTLNALGRTALSGMVVSGLSQVVAMGIEAAKPSIRRGIDTISGFSAQDTQVSKALIEPTIQKGGRSGEAILETAGRMGVGSAAAAYLAQSLSASVSAKAGAQLLSQQADLFKAAFAQQSGSAPTGLIGGYGGVMGGSFLAEFLGGGKGYSETAAITMQDLLNARPPQTPSLSDMSDAARREPTALAITDAVNAKLKELGSLNTLSSPQWDVAAGVPFFGEGLAQGLRFDESRQQFFANVQAPINRPADEYWKEQEKAFGQAVGAQAITVDRQSNRIYIDPEQMDLTFGKFQREAANAFFANYVESANRFANMNNQKSGYTMLRPDESNSDQVAQFYNAAMLSGDAPMAAIAAKGYVVVDPEGNVIGSNEDTAREDYLKFTAQSAAGQSIQDPQVIAASMATQLRVTGEAAGLQSMMSNATAKIGQNVALLANQLLPSAAGILSDKGPSGLGKKQESRLRSRLEDQQERQTKATDTIKEFQQSFLDNQIMNFAPHLAEAFTNTIAEIENTGNSILSARKKIANIQLGQATLQFTNNLRLANRALSDALGLAGRGGGSDNLGALQRTEFFLQREMQSISMAMEQRQINFSVAQAGFTAPGISSEEREGRIREAKIEARFRQRQLDIQRELFGVAGQQFNISAERGVVDAAKSKEILQKSFYAEKTIAALNADIATLNAELQTKQEEFGTIINEVNTNFSTVLSNASQLAVVTGDLNLAFIDFMDWFRAGAKGEFKLRERQGPGKEFDKKDPIADMFDWARGNRNRNNNTRNQPVSATSSVNSGAEGTGKSSGSTTNGRKSNSASASTQATTASMPWLVPVNRGNEQDWDYVTRQARFGNGVPTRQMIGTVGKAAEAATQLSAASDRMSRSASDVMEGMGVYTAELTGNFNDWYEEAMPKAEAIAALLGSATTSASGGASATSNNGSGPRPAAAGFMGMVNTPTMFLAGEAGPEHVLVLRNPKFGTASGGGGGGGSASITINIVNPSVRNRGDMEDLERTVTRAVVAAMGREAQLRGLRRPGA